MPNTSIIYLYQANLIIFNMASALDVSAARSRFPALQQEQVYMDNAGEINLHFDSPANFEIYADCQTTGGSQVLDTVADSLV